MKKLFSILLCLCLCLTLTSAGFAAEGAKVLKIGDARTLAALGPFQSITVTGASFYALYETLANRVTSITDIVGCIAKSWTRVGDLDYDVEIYDYVYDSAGNHITADDVVYCYTQMMEVNPTLTYNNCEKISDYVVRITLKEDVMGGIEDAMQYVPIVSKAEYEKSADMMASNPITTSRFVVSDFVAGTSLTMVRNENYWQKDENLIANYARTNYDQLEFYTISEASQQTIALQTGIVDVFEAMSTSQVGSFMEGGSRADHFTVLQGSNGSTLYSVFFSGAENSLLANDVNLRKAICYAIDQEANVIGAMNKLATAARMFGDPKSGENDVPSYYTEENSYFSYNPDLAKEYLAKSDYQGQKLRFLSYSGDKDIQILENYLNAVGIYLEISRPDLAVYQQTYSDPTQYDLAICRNSVTYNSNLWYKQYNYTSKGVTRHGWVNDELRDLVAAFNTVDGHTQENCDKISQILDENAYGRALYVSENYFVLNDQKVKVTGTPVYTVSSYIPVWSVLSPVE